MTFWDSVLSLHDENSLSANILLYKHLHKPLKAHSTHARRHDCRTDHLQALSTPGRRSSALLHFTVIPPHLVLMKVLAGGFSDPCWCFRKCPSPLSDSPKNCRSIKQTVSWFAIRYSPGADWAEFSQWRSLWPLGEERGLTQDFLHSNPGLKTLEFTHPLTNLQFPEEESVTLHLGRNMILCYF